MKSAFLCCLLCLLAHGARGADVDCTSTKDACTCATSDGTTNLDISRYLTWPQKDIVDQQKPYKYTYGPCALIECDTTSGKSSHACQFGAAQGSTIHFSLSEGIDKWTVHSTDPLHFTILYKGHVSGDNVKRTTSVEFTHSDADTSIAFDYEDDSTHTYYFTVTGKGVVAGGCGGDGDGDDDDGSHKTSTCSIGWMLVALAFAGLVTYIVMKGLIKYFHRGVKFTYSGPKTAITYVQGTPDLTYKFEMTGDGVTKVGGGGSHKN